MAARLRKTFRYPDDTDEPSREELDEEEQEKVIERLQLQNDQGNATYSLIFTLMPLLSTTAFLPSILFFSSSVFERLLSLLSAVSLTATAYAMAYLPFLSTVRKAKVTATHSASRAFLSANTTVNVFLALVYVATSPDASWLVNTRPVLYLIPGGMLITVLIAQRLMVSVDLSLLESLRYEYKGA